MKTFKLNKKYTKYILLVGLFLLFMGLSAMAVIGNWEPISLGLIITGIVAIGIWLVSQGNNDLTSPAQAFWGRRSTQTGTNAAFAMFAFVVILGLINFLGNRYNYRLDLTENNLYTLSPETQQLVRNLNQPVKVWIFDQTQSPQDKELLENYRRQGANFSFEYVDPNINPGLAKKFGVKDPGEVYVESGEKRKYLQKVREAEPLSEQTVTNAIQQIKSDRTAKVYFLQGHGERSLETIDGSLSEAVQSLKDKNFQVESLKLAETKEIPKDAALIVIAAPQQALLEGEVTALKEYQKRGGNLLITVDQKTKIPGLEPILQDWGIGIDDRIVVNGSEFQVRGLGPTAALVSSYGNHPITQGFQNRYSFYPSARAINIVKVIENVKSTPLLFTSEQSWAESNLDKIEFNADSDQQGPLILGIALSRPIESATPQPSPISSNQGNKSDKPNQESRMVVLGNTDFATNGLFSQQINGDVFLNSISWLSQQDDRLLSISPKEQKNRRINMTFFQANLLAWLSIIIVPFLGLLTAGFVWWRRR
ncbi:Gldg family protein [Phormidium sp. LEGE 05292]|uniref:GldG family protein n=1 Tax=[Phormidium] sp. LEGE 05292 TaxID=767427 RepID=UPI001882EA54|nr:Gldg family protein [Phormidium sp. LEGE 05292]MBE9226942.1 Gldg family protein [Phormidium sp. LEGE 05292]